MTWGGAQREIGVKVAGRGSLALLAGPDVEPELTAVRQFIGPAQRLDARFSGSMAGQWPTPPVNSKWSHRWIRR